MRLILKEQKWAYEARQQRREAKLKQEQQEQQRKQQQKQDDDEVAGRGTVVNFAQTAREMAAKAKPATKAKRAVAHKQ